MQLTLELIPSALARLLYHLVYPLKSFPRSENLSLLKNRRLGAEALGIKEKSTVLSGEIPFYNWGLDPTQMDRSGYRRKITIALVAKPRGNPHGKTTALLREDQTIQLLDAHLPEPLKIGNSYNLEDLYQAAKRAMDQLLTVKAQGEGTPPFSTRDLELLTVLTGCSFNLANLASLPLGDQISHYQMLMEAMGNALDKLSHLETLASKLRYEFSHRRDVLSRANSVIEVTEIDLENLAIDPCDLGWN